MPLQSPVDRFLKRAKRGAIEGAIIGLFIVLFRIVRTWWVGDWPQEPGNHLVDLAVYAAVVVGASAYILGIGRGISGGWVGGLVGAVVLGVAALWACDFVFVLPGGPGLGPVAIFSLVNGMVFGTILGALVERQFWVRRRRGTAAG